MSHPHHEHRQHRVEKRRVSHILKGYAHGGAVEAHEDEKQDRAMVKRMVKPKALRASGGAVKARMDRAPRRAKGGGVKHKGKITVNVVVGHPGAGAPPPMMPAPPPVAALPPRPPMAPPMAGPPGMPPGLPPGGPPPGMMPPGGIRKHGGRTRTYKRGGGVKDGPAWKEGLRDGTQVQHADGKDDGKDIGRGRVVTYKTGGAVEHPKKGGMAPKLPGGGGGGEARLAKQKRARKDYATPKGAHG